jgi:hypothetical protein
VSIRSVGARGPKGEKRREDKVEKEYVCVCPWRLVEEDRRRVKVADAWLRLNSKTKGLWELEVLANKFFYKIVFGQSLAGYGE